MRTLVAHPAGRGPGVAGAALRCEGWPFEAMPCAGPAGYGEQLADRWRRSPNGLILVEDDVAPWPGALYELERCPRPWCAFDYCVGSAPGFGVFRGLLGLGCAKFGPALTAANPDWEGVEWRQLDASVRARCRAVTGLPEPHEHGPPVAHAQGMR